MRRQMVKLQMSLTVASGPPAEFLLVFWMEIKDK